ncbi:MAG: type IV pilus twitching motility protein PilT [Vulcanimicrobiaceae bacterium]
MNSATMRFEEILRASRERGASDVHLSSGEAPVLRIDGVLHRRSEAIIGSDEIEAFIASYMDERLKRDLFTKGNCDVVLRRADLGTLRLHVFKTVRGMHCAVRIFPCAVPPLGSLDLPPVIEDLAARQAGLLLIVGPAGSGKTTLLAAIVDRLNETRACNVITVEDPIEYLHSSKRCVISQGEVGRDAPDFPTAVYGALRADPDVIVIGEARDTDSLKSTLLAAETGHLVLVSLHTRNAPQALERIVDSFPVDGREQVRIQLAQTLAGVIALRLVARAGGKGRRAAVEILIATDAVRNLIREGKTHQLRSVMQTGRNVAMQTLEMHLRDLVRRREITAATAVGAALHPTELDFSGEGVA